MYTHTHTHTIHHTDPEDYSGIARSAAPLVVLNSPNLPVVCFNISIVNDSDIEPPEMFQLLIDFNFMNDVTVEGCPSNVTILDRRTCTMSTLLMNIPLLYVTLV